MSMVARRLLTNAVAGPSRGAGASQIGRYRASEHTSRGLSGLASRLTYPGRAAATDCSASSDNIERFLASCAAEGGSKEARVCRPRRLLGNALYCRTLVATVSSRNDHV